MEGYVCRGMCGSMGMKFDREAPGEGAEAVCRLENGKAVLEWRFYFAEEAEGNVKVCGCATECEDCRPEKTENKNGGCNPESAVDSSDLSSIEITEGRNSRQDLQEMGGNDKWKGSEGVAGRNDRRGGEGSWLIRIVLTDMQGNAVLEGIQPLHEEEPLRSVLVQPHLWSGARDPYLYRLEAYLTDRDGRCLDHISRSLPLRTVLSTGDAGRLSLNGEVLEKREVSYLPPSAASETERQRLIMEDLRRLLRLGANSVFVEGIEGLGKPFLHLCDRYGLLLFSREKRGAGYARFCGDDSGTCIPWEESVPCFRGGKHCLFQGADGQSGFLFSRDSGLPVSCYSRDSGLPNSHYSRDSGQSGSHFSRDNGLSDCLFTRDSTLPTSLFYRYLAKWSREPFVYIVPESVKRLKSGNYSVRCYSSCERIVLYSDGALFEFQRGKEEFSFTEVPAKTPCIMLTAEGDGCSASLSLSKTVCPFIE